MKMGRKLSVGPFMKVLNEVIMMRCDNCLTEDTYIKNVSIELEVEGKKIKVNGERRFCKKCDSLVYDEKLDSIFLNEAYKIYNRNYGILGDKIVELRKKLNLSQSDFSKIIGCAKKTLISYEKDKSIPNDSYSTIINLLLDQPSLINSIIKSNEYKYDKKELEKINKKLGLFLQSDDYDPLNLSGSDQELSSKNGYTKFQLKKFLNAILFFAQDGVLKTKLLKELFYADFIFYKENACSITGSSYAHINYGPVPDNYEFYLNFFQSKGYIDFDIEYHGEYEAFKIKDMIEFDPLIFSKDELAVLNKVKKRFKDFGSKQIANFSHEEAAYKETKANEIISYDYALELKDF